MPETRHYCPHCEEKVSLSTYHRHKQLYYNEKSKLWITRTAEVEAVSTDESEDNQDYDETFEGMAILYSYSPVDLEI